MPLHLIELTMLMVAIKHVSEIWIGGFCDARQVVLEMRDMFAAKTRARAGRCPNCNTSSNNKVDC
jgi:hypothetical protein